MTAKNNLRKVNPERLSSAHKIKYDFCPFYGTSLNKKQALRDELRKVQNSVTVLERQRSPGASYWTSRSEASNSRTSISSIPDASSSSPLPPSRNGEEINYEYLRNVVLQFLEHKEMRVGTPGQLTLHASDRSP